MEVPLLVNDFLRRAVQLYPNKTAIVDGSRRFSYSQFQERVNRLSNALLELGVRPGDRVCILSPNSHYFLESFFGTSQIGAVLVPLNYRLVAADHAYILDHAGVRVVLADAEYARMVDEIRDQLPTVEHFVSAGTSDGPLPENWADWDPWVETASPMPPPPPELSENDLVSINYTSGTTARPKGVMLTHRNFVLNAYNLIAHLGIRHDDVELWTLPLFHCNGWGGVYALTGLGGTHIILRDIDAARIFELIQEEKVTFACMAPAVLRTILDHPGEEAKRVETRPRFTVAGAPPPAAFIERLETELGWEFIQIYGLTETAPLLTVSKPDHETEATDWTRRSRAGVPGLGVEIEVRDENDQPVPRDGETVGEICVRSNVVFAGYWEQPDQTAEAIRDGWFHTGDLAVWDESASLHIVDRKKDVIISGGENISSPEIEDALYQHPAVLECAVIGVPDEKWGETPKALVVLRPGEAADEPALIAFCRERLAHFKCPTSVELVDELPRTATGKLQKFRLREKYWDEGSRRIH
ncbi:MAG: long-chain-fatty-acid--CoA ligase [Myxococcota bacterium]|nr:long-chain-fatty-acid--CoA ligase [Myxococcota bacterium]